MFVPTFARPTTAEGAEREAGRSSTACPVAQTVPGEKQTSHSNAAAVQHRAVPLLVHVHQLRALGAVPRKIRNVHHNGPSFDHIW